MAKMLWDEEADVVVVGYGGAGAVSAITAHDAGVSVMVLEKQMQDTPTATYHSCNTRMAGGSWFCPSNAESAITYLEGMVRAANEILDCNRRELIRIYAQGAVDSTAWMRKMGAEKASAEDFSFAVNQLSFGLPSSIPIQEERMFFPEIPQLPGSDCAYVYRVKRMGSFRHGAAFFKVLSDNVQQRDIPVLWGTRAIGLVSSNGHVRGVIAQQGNKRVAIRASRGVILTCGGFEFNDEMKAEFLRLNPMFFDGNPGNTGDGIILALRAGAALVRMNCAPCRVMMKFPEHPVAFSPVPQLNLGGFFVDKYGRRFTNEHYNFHSFGYEVGFYDSHLAGYPRVPCYWIFDNKRKQAGSLSSTGGPCNPPGGVPGPSYYVWSDDNEVEIARGWVLVSSTINGLAKKMGADPDNGGMMRSETLEETLADYNALCKNGDDPRFRRDRRTLVALGEPPFYAIKLWPGGPNTLGGPRRNARAQVVGLDGAPLPRLYSAGELGSIWGMHYQVGGMLSECIIFGRIAGENAAGERVWK